MFDKNCYEFERTGFNAAHSVKVQIDTVRDAAKTVPITYADNGVHLLRLNFSCSMFLSNSFYDVSTTHYIAMVVK